MVNSPQMTPNPNRSRAKLTAVDVFAGCGGVSEGLRAAGFRVLAAVEVDPVAAETYRRNHRATYVYEADVRTVRAAEMMRRLRLIPGKLDLLAGCPPCQGFSSVSRLNGARRIVDRKQKDLLFEMLRFTRALKPKAVMLENVRGLGGDRRWSEFVADLRTAGYKCSYGILDAADFGVPQRRKRLLLLATRSAVVPFARPAKIGRTVRDAIEKLPRPGKTGDPLHDFPERHSAGIRRLISKIPKDGGSRAELEGRFQLPCHKSCDGFKDIYGRMAWDDVAPTITTGCTNPSKGRFLHPEQHRAITLREAALLQSFPRRYRFSLARGKQGAALLIGNAFPPEFVRRNALPIAKVLRPR